MLKIKDGFAGQRMYVIPTDILDHTSRNALLRPLYITDTGYFPAAKGHYIERTKPIDQFIIKICTSGTGYMRFDNCDYTVKAGQAVIIPAMSAHHYRADENDPWTIYWAHFKGERIPLFLQYLKKNNNKIDFPIDLTPWLHRSFFEIFAAISKGYTLENQILISSLFNTILTRLIFTNPEFHPNLEPEKTKLIDKTIEYMMENLKTPAAQSLELLSSVSGLSIPHYSRLFKIRTGYSPVDYFIRLKIQQACEDLASTSQSVKEIAYSLGYDDQYYFSRLFTKIIGLSPANYRKSYNS